MRTLIYARFSSQLQNSRSIDQQVEACRERAEREGWPVLDVFADYAISGGAGTAEAQRPGLAAMLARVEAGGVDQVLVDTTSRIARNQGDSHHIRDRLNHYGCRLFTLGDGEIDRFKGAIKGLLDEQQRVELRHNIKRGQRGAVRQGRSPAGKAYGYRLANRIGADGVPVRGLREIDGDEAEIVRRIFREYDAGDSPVTIARRLNEEGVPGPRGSRWRATTLRPDRTRGNGLLANRLYVGELVHNRTSKVIDPVTRGTRIRPNPPSEWIMEAVPQLAIVDRALFDRVQDKIAANRIEPGARARRPKHLLSGLGECGECGGSWISVKPGFWACGGRREGASCGNNRQIGTENYERRVLEGLQRRMLDPALVAVYVKEYHEERARRSADSRRRAARAERKLEESSRKVDRLVAAIAEGAGEFQEVRAALALAKAERDGAEAELHDIAALPVVALHPGVADDYRRQVADLARSLADPEARPGAIPALRTLIDRIVLTPNPDGRGVNLEVHGRLNAIIALATGAEPTARMIELERVKGIEPSS